MYPEEDLPRTARATQSHGVSALLRNQDVNPYGNGESPNEFAGVSLDTPKLSGPPLQDGKAAASPEHQHNRSNVSWKVERSLDPIHLCLQEERVRAESLGLQERLATAT